MINLANDNNCDTTILQELQLAGIPIFPIPKSNTEVPFSNIGILLNWKFTRSWYYWSATVESTELGLPLEQALVLYNNGNRDIRAGGDYGSPSPECYVAQPIYNKLLYQQLYELGYKYESHPYNQNELYIPITVGEIADLCNSGKLKVNRYVKNYHIDSQYGLLEFANFLKTLYSNKLQKKIENDYFLK